MTELISDKQKFRKLKEDPTLKHEGALQRTLCEMNKKKIFSDIEYSNLYPKGIKPARLYGTPKTSKAFLPGSLSPFQPIVSSIITYNYNLAQYLGSLLLPYIPSNYSTPKIHKAFLPGSFPPFRPILSSIITSNYSLAQYLGSLLSPHIPSEYSTKDSFTFIEEIESVSVTNKFLISFDVTSLFTNILLSEATDIAIRLIFGNSPDKKFTKHELQKPFRIATFETHFTFNDSIYDQTDCVAMGSPLTPVLVNLFMGFHEQNWIEQAIDRKPIFYKRYVDDIFAIFESESDADAFYSYLNTRHENIKFTFEKEKDNKLPFLDILINNNESDLQNFGISQKDIYWVTVELFQFCA